MDVGQSVPLYRQPIRRQSHLFMIESDFASGLLLEQVLMVQFLNMAITRRQVIDEEMYPAAQRGYRFKKGNSAIAYETYLGVPTRICLSYANSENADRELSPSNLNPSRIQELAWQLRQEWPSLVTLQGLLALTAAETAARHAALAPPPRSADIVAFAPRCGDQPAFA